MDVGLWHMLAQSHLYQTSIRKAPKHSLFLNILNVCYTQKLEIGGGNFFAYPDWSLICSLFHYFRWSCFSLSVRWTRVAVWSRSGADFTLRFYSVLPPKRVFVSSTAFPVVPVKCPTTWKRSPLSSLLESRVAPISIIAGLTTFLHISE